jgi:hypothetical protein
MGTTPVFSGWPFRGLYASRPCVIDDQSFAEYRREDGQRVAFLWLAPVHTSEIDFVRKYGAPRLEALFADRNVDLVDLDRKSIVDQLP